MIHIGKSERPAQAKTVQGNSTLDSSLDDIGQYEEKVGKWIERNLLLSIGIALAVGVGMGWILKRRL